MFLATLSTELRNLSNMFLALRKFKEDPWGFGPRKIWVRTKREL